MNKIFALFIISAGIACFCSCASLQKKEFARNSAEILQSDSQTSGQHDERFAYMLGPDDVIDVTVEQHPEWSGAFTIDPDGKITIQGLGEISARGISPKLLEIDLSIVIAQYITSPRVAVKVLRYASQAVYVLGEVNRPGKYNMEGRVTTLRDAVVMAGLPKEFADNTRVYVITPSQNRPLQQVINLERILYRGEMKMNIQLMPGDIVFIPKNLLGVITEFFRTLLSPVTTTTAARSAVAVP